MVSLSLDVYTGSSSSVGSVEILRNRIDAVGGLPSGKLYYSYMLVWVHDVITHWIIGWALASDDGRLILPKLDISHGKPEVQYGVLLLADLTWILHVYGVKVVTSQCQLIADTPSALNTVIAVQNMLDTLDKSYICLGNPDDKFQSLQKMKGFLNKSSKYTYTV